MEANALVTELRRRPAGERVFTALDVPDAGAALALAERLGPAARSVKVGMQLFTAAGPDVVRALRARGLEVFLDLKYHDIPNTVAGAVRSAAALGVEYLTLHAGGGRRMLEAAVAAAREAEAEHGRRPVLLAVTVLTSLTLEDLDEVAPGGGPLPDRLARLARTAAAAGCDGLVCSPADLPLLRDAVGDALLKVTPGVRPAGGDLGDQRRVTTPAQALAGGADFLVVGRPITGAPDPAAALAAIAKELSS
ncbi:MAG TPA: orotidine-5'-phosphate decarboxylase [Candidatus Krumholzibacteria bacterium]|nr:orotidine-5'-phosphate decarboxylase [Candidatus Krumholzibacteria bacterium]